MEKRVYTVATAHLDTVWRWNLATTIKDYLTDTISKNFYLFQKIPHYKFNFEGAFRYELIEEYYPDLFEQIQEYSKYGQWNVAGSSYENGDVNIPSPEALFRNILIGNNYFEEKFSTKTKDIFLPDCFGFGLALPSVINHANLKGFITQKLSWGCAFGKPFDIGRWKGIDGSVVFASTDGRSYRHKFTNVRTDVDVVEKLDNNEKIGSLPWTLSFHGDGDIGGAPTENSALAVSKAVDTNDGNNIQVISATADELFNDLSMLPKSEQEKLPLCENELLMTDHAVGGYTSRAMSKRLNRKNEMLADLAERSCVVASQITSYKYPKEQLNRSWKRVIQHQFHDDIPGTSIMSVYNDSWNDYFKSLSQFKNEYVGSVSSIVNMLDTSFVQGVSVVVNNAVCADRIETVNATVRMAENVPYVRVFDSNGNEVQSQVVTKRGKTFEIIFKANVQPVSYTVYDVRPSGTKCTLQSDLKVSLHAMENSKYSVLFNKNGDIASIVDKRLKTQILSAPIKLALIRDVGALEYPSWELRKNDIDREPYAYANTPEFEIVEQGSARVTIRVSRSANGSTFTQYVSLDSDSEVINVYNEIEWLSRRTLLKAQFPLTCSNNVANYDLGLGVIKRGNNTDNLYEVPAQKWADVTNSDNSFGVTILSDCKYGWDKPDDNLIRLTCIHTPTGAFIKDARQDLQDLGLNRFSYGIYSHKGGYQNGSQIQGEFFNQPLVAFQTSSKRAGEFGTAYSFANVNNNNVLIRAMKMAEKTEEIIVRFNECSGEKQSNIEFSISGGIESAKEVYADEDYIADAKITNGRLVFDINAFEPKTFALTLKAPKYKCASENYKKLRLDYNVDVVTSNYNRQLTIMAASGTSLPKELFPKSVTCGGVTFRFADLDQQFNALIPKGQVIDLPKGCTKLYILACGVRGDKELEFFLDGTKQRIVKVHDFIEPIGQWDMYALNQIANVKDPSLAYEFTHLHTPEDDWYGQSGNFYKYEIDINRASQLTLPEDNSIIILAMTAVKRFSNTKIATQLIDTVDERVFVDTADTFDKVVDKLDTLTIRAGLIADQKKGGKGKGILRNNIITNVVRSFTKSEW